MATSTLRPYQPTTTPTAQVRATTSASQAPLGPTPTPLVHVIQSNQTLIGIAILYGVDLEDLLLANPGVDPQFLSVGMELIIPGESGQPVDMLLPTPTPVPLALSPVRCFTTTSNGLWCLLDILNDTADDVEGLVSLIYLLDDEGEVLEQRAAYGPLNRLQMDSHMPLVSYFPSFPEEMDSAVASMLSAVPVNDAELRYRDVEVRVTSKTLEPDGLSLVVRGGLETIAGDQETEVRIRLLLVGLDQFGDVVGFRIWERDSITLLGETEAFECTVYSFGGRIESFEVMAEARIVP